MILGIVLGMLGRFVKAVAIAALTPILEKNVFKTVAAGSPVVVSMSRLIAVAFAVVMLREFWLGGINGWPDAMLGITTVLALPLMKALEAANQDEVLEVARALLARLPSELDNHRKF
jgi:hypothetical protein